MGKWREQPLGSLVAFEYGAALGAGSRTGSGFCVYGSNGVVGRHELALVSGPGIIVGRKGSIGALQWSELDFWPIDTTYWVKPKVDLDLRWVREALRLVGLERLDSSTGVPGLNRSDAYERSVPVPPLEEQRRIAEVLDTIDETIQATERVIAKRRALRAGLAADLLKGPSAIASSETSRPNEAQLRTVLTSTSRNPAMSKWESRPIEELVALVSSGGTPRAGDPRYYTEFGTPFLKIDDITKSVGRFVDKAEQSITDLALDESAAKIFPAGTVLVTMYGTMGVTKTLRSPMATNQAIAALVPPFRCDPNYLAHALSFRRAGLERFAAQTTQPNISGTIIRRFRLPVPPLEEQRRIAEILDTADGTVQRYEAELVKLGELRAGIAADLLSGRVRTVAA